MKRKISTYYTESIVPKNWMQAKTFINIINNNIK